MSITNLLATNSFILVNKKLAWLIGFKEAAFFGELCGEHDYWETREKLIENGYFYSTVLNIYKNTTFGETSQRTMTEKLIKIGLIETKRMGQNGYRYIKINQEKLIDLLSQNVNILKNYTKNTTESNSIESTVPTKQRNRTHENVGTGYDDPSEPVPLDHRTNNNIYNNNIEKNNIKIESTVPLVEVPKKSSSSLSNKNSNSKNIENIFDKTLKEKRKEEKDLKKEIKNKIQLGELRDKSSLENFIEEKLSDIDNEESRKRKEQLIAEITEKKITTEQKKKLRIKNCRLEEAAAKHFNNDIIKLLGDYIDMYHEKYDILPKQTWEYILGDLATINDNPSLIIECIKNSIVNAYRRIYVSKPSQSRPNSPDKLRGNLTEEERTEIENNLARNDDGSLMQF